MGLDTRLQYFKGIRDHINMAVKDIEKASDMVDRYDDVYIRKNFTDDEQGKLWLLQNKIKALCIIANDISCNTESFYEKLEVRWP